MSKEPNEHAPESKKPRTNSAALLLIGDMADTTWRMFIPTIGLTLLGWYADSQVGTKPWLFIFGIIIGSTIAGVLIKRQLKRIQENR